MAGTRYLIVNAVDGMAAGAYYYRRDAGTLELLKAGGDVRHENYQDGVNDDVHHRAGNGDDQFLPGLVRDATETGHPTHGVEGNVTRSDAKGSRCEGVAKLVQKDAGEKDQDEKDALESA